MTIMQKICSETSKTHPWNNVKSICKIKSSYNSSAAVSKVNFSVLTAFWKYQQIINNSVFGSIALDKNGRYLAEYYLNEEQVECAVYNPENGNILAGLYDLQTNQMHPYSMDNDMSLLILVLIEKILLDEEANHAYESICLDLSDLKSISNWDHFSDTVALLSDNVLYRLKNKTGIHAIKNNFDDGNIKGIPMNSILSNAFCIETEFFGKASVFNRKGKKTNRIIHPDEFNGIYKFTNTKYPEKKVAKISDSYYVPENIIEICELIKASSSLNPPIRNILLYGESGSGKTEGSYAIAAGLGMPYVTYTCHPHTDNFDLIGQFVPVTGNSAESISIDQWLKDHDMPGLADVCENPKETYKKLTGKNRVQKSISVQDVIPILFEEMFLEMSKSKKNDFTFVHSEIIEALKNGFLVEIQEPTVILNEGVLVGLNAILAGGYIRLANGEQILRHPDSIVIFTTNSSDYIGYGKMSNSVLSRCSLAYEMNTPSIDEMVVRAMKKTQFNDQNMIRRMAECIEDIAEKLKDSGVKDGVTGFRELLDWITVYRITGNIYKAAIPTIINKATFNSELRSEIEDIISTEIFS